MEARSCPLCGEDRPKKLKRTKPIYGHPVCKKCYRKFINPRQIAWVIDFFAIRIAVLALFFVYFMISPPDMNEESTPGEDLAAFVLVVGFFLAKDGFSGYSIGKLITGVRVVDNQSGEPAGVLRSIKRNLILLVPFMPIVVGFSLGPGPRLGDGWAKTRVIWRRYRTNMVFSPPEAVAKVFD